MRCHFILPSGHRCNRRAQRGAKTCAQHRRPASPDPPPNPSPAPPELHEPPPPFYAAPLPAEGRHVLNDAAQLEGLDAEITLLRLLIREHFAHGDLAGARRAIETLARIHRTPQAQRERSDRLSRWLEQALDDVGK